MTNEVLLIPDKTDAERDSIAESWNKNGGEVIRIAKFWKQPKLDPNKRVTIYGSDTFSLVLAQVLNLKLIEPKDELIIELHFKWIKRAVEMLTIAEVSTTLFPIFIKPLKPKAFKSKVYDDFDSFVRETKGIEQNAQVIKSSVIEIASEVRAFILNKEILDLAGYEGNSDLNSAKEFLTDFLQNYMIDLPKTYVIDLGHNQTNGWFVIEFNASWGAGLNSCNPDKVIAGIREATMN